MERGSFKYLAEYNVEEKVILKLFVNFLDFPNGLEPKPKQILKKNK